MSSIWGENLKISLFGESHGPGVGVVIDGFPPGISLDFEKIGLEMGRRRPNTGAYSTRRKEADDVELLSGLYDGKTTGAPICGFIRNNDAKSGDYGEMSRLMRPGHADYTGFVRYKGFNDIRGGGHFSARLTAPIVFAGAVARQYLDTLGISIGSHIYRIHDVPDLGFDMANITGDQLNRLRGMDIPVNDMACVAEYMKVIEEARSKGDSVGGVIETAALNIPAGLGSPIFGSVESRLSSFLFSIPAVKGVEFGAGFAISEMYGSEANDSFYISHQKNTDMETKDTTAQGYPSGQDRVMTKTNNNGGINGGITNGMPLVFRVAMKPTPSISLPQDTVDIKAMENAVIKIKGRHDACIVPRAVPVIEAAAAIVLCDLYLDFSKQP